MRRVTPATLLLLTTALLGGCGTRWDGAHFIEDEACWETGFAFFSGPGADDMEIFARDPNGDCWHFSSWPELPSGWTVDFESCQDLPGVEDAMLTAEAMCE